MWCVNFIFFRIVDLAWNDDEVILLEFAFKTSAKIAKIHVFNKYFRPSRSCVLRKKEHPRSLAMLRRDVAAVGYTFIGTIEFWNTKTFSCLYVLRAHSASINTIMFSDDSTQMFSVSENRAIKIWDLQKIRQIAETPAEDTGSQEVKDASDVLQQLANHEEFATNVHQVKVLASGDEVLLSFAKKAPVVVNLAKNLERKIFESPHDSGEILF